jgi:hypothetical protein
MISLLAHLPHERRDTGYARADRAKAPKCRRVFAPSLVPEVPSDRGRVSGTNAAGTQ